MGKRFTTMLLTGKAATLPLLIQQAHALTPSYTDVLSTELTQIQVPVANQVQLDSLGSTYGTSSSLYGGTATLCSNTAVASKISLVITGLKNNDTVFVATSTNTGGSELLDSRIKIGTNNLIVPIRTEVRAPADGTVALTVPLSIDALRSNGGYTFANGNKFYLQTIVFPAEAMSAGQLNWQLARISEMDTISVGSCQSTYGTTY
jgi:hypothetical protein